MRADPTMAIFLSSAISGFPFLSRLHRTAEERRKARPQDHPDVGEIGIGDNAFGDHRLRRVDQRFHQLATECAEIAALRPLALLRLAVDPFVKALAALATELLLLDQRRKARIGWHLLTQFPGDAGADIEPHSVHEFNRSHRHAEGHRRRVDTLLAFAHYDPLDSAEQ